MTIVSRCFALLCVTLVLVALMGSNTSAQPPAPDPPSPAGGFKALELPQIGGLGSGTSQSDGIDNVTAEFTVRTADRPALLFVTAEIEKGWHIYSVTQRAGGPIRTKIDVTPSDAAHVVGDFVPTVAPESHAEEAFHGLQVESHTGTVTWYAPIEIAAGVDPASLTISGTLTAQACTETACLPPKKFKFTARLGNGVEVPTVATAPPPTPERSVPAGAAEGSEGTYQPAGANVAIHGHIEAGEVPGSYRLVIGAEPKNDFHAYELVEQATGQSINKPTLMVLTETSGLEASRPRADRPVVEKPSPLPELPPARLYEGPVSWTVALSGADEAAESSHRIEGILGYQVCSDTACDRPQAVRFTADLPATLAAGEELPVTFTKASYSEAAELAKTHPWPAATFDPSQIAVNTAQASSYSMGQVLVFGFLGGLILNLMPCVLPVVGLKIMSFVAQAGESRSRVLALNIWFSLGLMSVFMVLAALAVFARMGWGQMFASNAFTIVMAAVIFAMGLSLLGVWEIPIPGFVGGTTAHGLESREGATGAFSKGVITTILATPCSGPFLGTALTWALRQPGHYTFAVFTAVGLGMASPYLAIGAFPRLIRFLPKPGDWMVTFKCIMGFVLLGTVVYLLSFTDEQLVVPTVTMLVGVGAGCWWIGQTPLTAERSRLVQAWVGGVVVMAVTGLVSFGWLAGVMGERFERSVDRAIAARISESGGAAAAAARDQEGELPWRPYTRASLEQHLAAGKTVMVDFTADWCLTCKTLEATVLNTAAIRDAVAQNGVVTLVADWTDGDPMVTEMLNVLGANQVPVLAIFPAGRPNEPIVLVDGYTQKLLLTKLDEAGPSKDVAAVSRTDAPETSRTARAMR